MMSEDSRTGDPFSVEDVTSVEVKERADEIGFHLVGIVDTETIREHPFPGSNDTTPEEVVQGAASIIVVALRSTHGKSSLTEWDNRTGHYSQELGLTALEEKQLDLVYWLEDHGHPSIGLPPEASRARQYDQLEEGPLSLPHLAVEAGLGTLGLNLQLLTPEYGPRVILGGVVTTADLDPDDRREEALCEGAECGRCLLACPGDAIDHFDMRVDDCRPYSQPWGYHRLVDRIEEIMRADSTEKQEDLIKSPESLMIWQSMLRGNGVNTGCTRCNDVCPVGADFDRIETDQRDIPESTDGKMARLSDLRRSELEGNLPPAFEEHARWIGDLDIDYGEVPPTDLNFDYLE